MNRPELRVGLGFDAHQFAADRRLVLGGVGIPHARGLEGHSDADAVLHALADALLGAAGLGDIGAHFPSSDPSIEGIDSARIVRRVVALLASAGWKTGNVDVTVVAQEPRLAPHIDAMRARIAALLDFDEVEPVSVKATTTDRMGSVGRGEGIAALAVATVIRSEGGSEAGSTPARRRKAPGKAVEVPKRTVGKAAKRPAAGRKPAGAGSRLGKRRPAGPERSR